MKVALFYYNGQAEGWERWNYVKDLETDNPTGTATAEFYIKHNTMPDSVKQTNCRVQIMETVFSDMFTAIKRGNGFQEVCLAIRLTGKKGGEE